MSVHAESTSAARPKARKAVHPTDVQHATDAGLDLLRVIGRLVLHNVSLPGRPDLFIDHVVAGPSGVYAINTIAPTGSVSMSGGILLCAGTSMMSDIHEVADSAAILRELLSGAPVAPILCFQRNAEVAGVVGEVAVCSTENILELLSGQPDVVDARTQREVMRVLSDSLVQAVRRERVEPEQGAKPRHRQKAWSLRRSNADETARKAEPADVPEPPRLVAEPVPVPPPAPKVELELVPELAPEIASEVEVDEVVEAAAPVLELAPILVEVEVEPEPEPEVEPEPAPVVEDVVPSRPVARAPARPAARAATRPAARPAARLPEAPPRVEVPAEARVEARVATSVEVAVEVAPVRVAPVRIAPAPTSGPVWTPAPAAADRPVVAAVEEPVEDVVVAPEGRHARTPITGPALKKASVLLARLAPAEPVESVSALKDAAFPVRPVLVPKVVKAPKPSEVFPEPVDVAVPEVTPLHPNSPQNIPPAPMPRPVLTVAAPPADEAPARRRLAGLVPVLVAALIVGAVLMLSPRVPAAVAWGKAFFTDPPVPAAGTLVHVDGTGIDPGYDLTASAPVAVRPAGTSVRPGHRLVAVKLRVHNGGTTKLALPVGSRIQVVDALGIGYGPATSVTKTNLGPALPKLVSVGPGATLVGTVVFSVPKARAVDQIQFELPGADDALAWDVVTS